MNRIRTGVIVLLALLVFLDLLTTSVPIKHDTKPRPDRMETASKIYFFTKQGENSQLGAEEESTPERFNITLQITDWKAKTTFGNMKVTVYDLERRRVSSHLSNETGHIDLKFIQAGPYVISVQKGNRIVGHQKILVKGNEAYTVKTWAYDLNITFVDENGNPLTNHTVFLYDQEAQRMFHVGTGNGTRTMFYLGRSDIVEGTVKVYLNNVLTTDYTLDYKSGELTFHSPPENMTKITADYRYWVPMAEDVGRIVDYTVMTEEHGPLVAQAETDENGTVHFAGLWNGTYGLKILGKESWITEYILGEPVLTLREPAAGEHIINLQEPISTILKSTKVDLKLRFISGSNAPVRNATVEMRNMLGYLLLKGSTNQTGFMERKNLYVIDGVYAVSTQYGNRVIGYKVIDVKKTETFTVECWTYDLTVAAINQDGKPLPGHIVLLYDQLVFRSRTDITTLTDQTGLLIAQMKTDENGIAHFSDVWNGTYRIRVMGGEIIGEETIDLQKPEFITIRSAKTSMSLRFVTQSGEPIPGATIFVFNDAGELLFRDRTDDRGYIFREGIYLDTYTVHAEWMGTQVWSGTVDVTRKVDKTIKSRVYRLTLNCVDPFGNRLPGADVVLRKRTSSFTYAKFLELEADETGRISILLPYGFYEVICSYGVYSGEIFVILDGDHVETVSSNVKTNLWVPIFVVAFPLVIFSLLLERRRLRTPLEIKRYKNMLTKLESMYKSGLVEYKIYRKLREEYEAKIMELGGREMR